MAKSYYEKLQDPRWQKKRLEVMEAAGFSCEWCQDEEGTLHVHHWYYARGADPWEYPSNQLTALCEDCHKQAHSLQAQLGKVLAKGSGDFAAGHGQLLETLIGYVKGWACGSGGSTEEVSGCELEGVVMAWGEPRRIADEIGPASAAAGVDGISFNYEGEEEDVVISFTHDGIAGAIKAVHWLEDAYNEAKKDRKAQDRKGYVDAGWWIEGGDTDAT